MAADAEVGNLRPRASEAELLSIGNELLLGQTIDRNSAWLARRLAEVGIRVGRCSTVGDDEDAIATAASQAMDRTGLLICTGGLGPTVDDVTKPVIAGLFGRELRLDSQLLRRIETRFRELGRAMPAVNRNQAEVPEGALVFRNPRGTAPGLALEDESGRLVILLPGVPLEMRGIFLEHVRPLLRSRLSGRAHPVRHLLLRTTGLPESELAERLAGVDKDVEPLGLAYLPSTTGVDLRLTCWGDLDETAASDAFQSAEALVRERVGCWVFGRGSESLAAGLGRELGWRNTSLALAESCTGGLIAEWLTRVPGASRYFLGGLVCYADSAKQSMLGVARETLQLHGAVSEEVLREMLAGVLGSFGCDAAIAVTGVAGPDGGTAEKPVGTVWVGAAYQGRVETRLRRFHGRRQPIRERAAQAALSLLWGMLRDD